MSKQQQNFTWLKFQVKSGLIPVENIKTEKDVFTALGLEYIKPQDRTLQSAMASKQ
jgi:hypothetical protein